VEGLLRWPDRVQPDRA